ncbi:PREDICTED: uncharacterized protein LOC107073209 [Polistes dominula]|uniref:Uncharacterized protein LOC107073209 n=1 Tax=Polistes dominula TaxID=743375 RepID=A0ABM1J9V7_POLDO|nr:PREDICTED: uncharacterized protein LOC107073209 [Polistes dominula]
MAPTVCLPELSVVKSRENLYTCRQQRICRIIKGKQQRRKLKRLTNNIVENPIVEKSITTSSMKNYFYEDNHCHESVDINISSSNISTKLFTELKEQCDVIFPRCEGLFSIVVRTLALVRRNRILQERVNALRAETQDFIRSILNNPQNKHKQEEEEEEDTIERNNCKDATVSSSTEEIVLKPTLSHIPSSRNSSPDIVTSTCQSPWENED